MNKKITAVVLLALLTVCCLMSFASCGDKYESVAGKTYHKWHFNPVGEGIIWDDGYTMQFWNDGKTVQARSPEGVRTGDYTQDGQHIKILWMGAIAAEDWHLEGSGKLLMKNNAGTGYDYRLKDAE